VAEEMMKVWPRKDKRKINLDVLIPEENKFWKRM